MLLWVSSIIQNNLYEVSRQLSPIILKEVLWALEDHCAPRWVTNYTVSLVLTTCFLCDHLCPGQLYAWEDEQGPVQDEICHHGSLQIEEVWLGPINCLDQLLNFIPCLLHLRLPALQLQQNHFSWGTSLLKHFSLEALLSWSTSFLKHFSLEALHSRSWGATWTKGDTMDMQRTMKGELLQEGSLAWGSR